MKYSTFIPFLLAAGTPAHDHLGFHEIRTAKDAKILPWATDDPGRAYDLTLKKVRDYWRLMPHFWKVTPEFKKKFRIGGDQFAMMLSSWTIYHAFTGDRAVVDDMSEQSGAYLANSLSPAGHAWPHLPYPCNLKKRADELVTLHKITGTLAAKTQPCDAGPSPMPIRVFTKTGGSQWPYVTKWTPTLRLFDSRLALKEGDGDEFLRLTHKPRRLAASWQWQALPHGGSLRAKRTGVSELQIQK